MRVVFIVLCFLVFTLDASAVDLTSNASVEVHRFGVGRNENSFTFLNNAEPLVRGPSKVKIDDAGNFYFLDWKQGAVLIYSAHFTLTGSIPGRFSEMELTGSKLVLWTSEAGRFNGQVYAIGKLPVQKIADFEFDTEETVSLTAVYIDGEYFFFESATSVFLSFRLVGKKLVIDPGAKSTNYRMQNGQLVSERYGNMSSQAGDFFLHKTGETSVSANGDTVDLAGGEIFATDNFGHRYVYTSLPPRVAVVESTGIPLRVFEIKRDNTPGSYVTSPAIDRLGNIYFLESTSKDHKLYRIAKSW